MRYWTKLPLLARVVLAIALGIGIGWIAPGWVVRIFATFNTLFGNFLGFIVPLLILGLVAPGIADIGRGAGKMLLVTAGLAYGFTIFSGFFTYFSCEAIFPWFLGDVAPVVLDPTTVQEELSHYFTVDMPPLMNITTALVTAFTLGLGMSMIKSDRIKGVMDEMRDIITWVINKAIIPLLPLYIFGIFLSMTAGEQVNEVLGVFAQVIVVIFVLTVVLLLVQFTLAGAVARRNPLRLLWTMLPAYATALGTQSSAATIPVTLERTIRNGVHPEVAGFAVPLCATIHLSGSTMKIVACSMVVMMLSSMPFDIAMFAGFILMLGITMIAAPGVPGGAIMAALGLLSSMLGFDEAALGLMIALYIAMDSFGTATNVTGDGAIAILIDKLKR